MISPAVILVRPREEGNVGAVARAMANMGLDRLVLVEPAPRLGGIARGFGIGGWDILDRAQRSVSFEAAVAPFSRLVATASRRQRPLHRHRVVTPRQLPEILAADPAGTRTALIFGPEDNGLQSCELEVCHPVVTVPCAPESPTLNLAQAVLVVAYELFAVRAEERDAAQAATDSTPRDCDALAEVSELQVLQTPLAEVLLAIGFDQEPIRSGLLRDLRRLLARAGPSDRDARLLRRLLNRTGRALASGGAHDDTG